MSTAIAGQKVDLTIFADPGKEPDVAYVLAACPTELAATNTSSAASITLSGIDGLVSPTAPGDYRWRSLVTPRGRKGYELQALVPLPEAVTLHSRYDAKRKLATLSGTVIEGGVVVPHVPLALISSRNGSTLDFVDAKTDGSGRFVVKVHVTRTTDFTVDVAPSVGPCTAASTAPAGCLASTTVPPDDTFATAWVSVPGGAVRAIRRGDQRLAERAGLRDDDVPADFEATLTGGDDCLNQKGESRLTITGESTSPAFYKLTQDETPTIAETLGVTRVYATSTQAKHAFDHEARISTMRCEVKRLGAKPSRIKPRQFAASARLRAFRATFNLGAGSTASYDVVFLQRGRTVTTLTFVFVNAPDDLEGAVTSAVATRMR